MKMFKKVIALLTVMFLVVGLLVGCGGTKQADSTTTKSTSDAAQEQSTVASLPLMEINILDCEHAGQLPGANNPNDIVTPEVEKKFNIKINQISPSGGKMPIEVINMMIAAGNLPDLIITDNPNIQAFYSQSVFADLSQYKDQLVNMNKWYSNTAWNMLKVDGKIVALPSGGDVNMDNPDVASLLKDDLIYRPMNNWVLHVREDILTLAGYKFKSIKDLQAELDATPRRITDADTVLEPAINTFEDIETLFYKIKSLNLKVNGKTVEALDIPDWGAYHLSSLIVPTGGFYYDKETDVSSMFLGIPMMKDFYKVLNKWVNDGILDKNWMIDKPEQLQAKIAGGQVATFFQTSDVAGARKTLKENNPEAEFRAIPWPTSKSGKKSYVDPSYPCGFANVMINKDVKDIPRLIEYLDWFSSDEALDLASWGPESAGLWEMKDGKKVFKDNALWEAIRDGKKTADGKSAEYYGIFDSKNPVSMYTSKAFSYAPTPPYNFKSYLYSYPAKMDAFNDLENYLSTQKLCRDGSVLSPVGPKSSAMSAYFWSTTKAKLAAVVYAKNDAVFNKEWDAILNDLKTKGEYDAANEEMLKAFRSINGK